MAHKSALEDEALLRATNHKIRYTPYGAAKEIFHRRDDEVLLVGPKGTGKSLGALQKLHLVLSKYPKSLGFMSRKTRTSMTNSCVRMYEDTVLKPPDRVHFHKQDQHFQYPNGSICAVIGMDNVDRLNSSEWDIGYMMEATEGTEHDWEICTACIRHGVVPYQQMMGDCNPDKPTHWLKARCDRGLTVELKSFHEDNPKFFNQFTQSWTPEGVRYMAKLKRLTGVRYKRLYMGEWAAAEGIVYDEYDPHIHLVGREELPEGWEEWPHYWSIDWGFTHPFVWQDWMEAPNGALYLNREYYRSGIIVEDAAAEIMAFNDGLPWPRAIICDHDPGDRATWERHTGLITLPAYKMIQPGVQAVKARLQGDWKDGRPGMFFLRDAPIYEDESLKDAGKPWSTVTEIDGYVWDEKVNRLVNSKKDEIPLDMDNHGMDALRYAVSFVDSLADDPQDIEGIMVYDGEVNISPY